MRSRVTQPLRGFAGIVVCLAIVAAVAPAAEAKGGKLKATVTRSAGGVPTIEADNYKSLGFGYGYTFASDNICTIANQYVTVNGERSLYFGPDADSPDGYSNLESDFFYKRIIDRQVIEGLLAQKPPAGPEPEVKQTVAGYVAGYNRYLSKTGVANISDPACAGAPWVRKIDKMDVYRRFYQLTQLASGQVAEDGIVDAAPPGAAVRPQASAATAPDAADVAQLGAELDARQGETGSNGWGLGSEATQNGSGMVLANPHFPWSGSERFYQSHLVIPGKLNVSGSSLYGSPVILIGHTQNLAWTHTVSTAFRFTPIELKLVPGDPTSYLVDGRPEKMESNDVTVQVKRPDGSIQPVTRTLYTTRYGPVFTTLQGQSLFNWSNTTAYALFDANAENLRLLNHFFETDRAQSTKQLLAILKKYEGIPWVNTMAADSKGRALYADIGSIPNVTDDQAVNCAGALGAITFPAIGLPTLDGSRSECAPGTDADSAAPGIFGPSEEPSMFRRDYVANSNDSYWLTNPEQPLEGYPRIIGDERTERSLRTRLGLVMLEQRLRGTDGYAGDKFTLNKLRRIEFNDRLYGAELLRSQVAAFCHANPMLTGSGGPVDVSAACRALDAFNEKQNLDSTGAILFRRFMSRLGSIPFTTPFSFTDPVHTPAGLDTSDPSVGTALANAVTDLKNAGIPFAAPLGDYQYEMRGDERIPIHGGPDGQGAFNVITDPWRPPAGYPDVTDGSSFIMVTAFGKNGKGCPRDRSILTYSESENPNSKYYADQTRLYSQKKWIDPPFCPNQVIKAAKSVKTIRGG